MLTACIVTWVSSALVALGSLASMAVVLVDSDDLIGQLRDQNPQLKEQGITDGVVIGIVVATVVGLVLWSVAASVLAFLTLRRRRWAAITLLVSGGCRGRALPALDRARERRSRLLPLAGVRRRRPAPQPGRVEGLVPRPVTAVSRESVRPSSPWSTVTDPPSSTWPLMSSLASGSPIACCTSRRSGRAP